MSSINGRGSINNGFAWNNIFYASGDATQVPGNASVTVQPGYNYLAYTPVVGFSFVIPATGWASRYVVADYQNALVGGASPSLIISGAQGAGHVFNGSSTSLTTSGNFQSWNVYNVSGVKWSVQPGN